MANRIIDEENVKIGRLLQNARESHGVLQSELCEATGLTKITFRLWSVVCQKQASVCCLAIVRRLELLQTIF